MSDRLVAVAGSIAVATLLAGLGCEAIIEAHFDEVDPIDPAQPAVTSGATSGSGSGSGATGCAGECPRCGDGVLDPGEACDDGNQVDGDVCRADCTCSPPSGDPQCTFMPTKLCWAKTEYRSGGLWGLTLGDLDGNNGPDVVGAGGENGAKVYVGDGCGGFELGKNWSPGTIGTVTSFAAADLDGDHDIDLAGARTDHHVAVLRNESAGELSFELAISPTNTGPGDASAMVTAGDLTGDGAPDLVIVDGWHAQVAVLTNDGQGGFSPKATPISVGSHPGVAAIGDLDGDGARDVVVADTDSDDVWVLRNDGKGALGAPVSYKVSPGPNGLVLADLNGDGRLDVATGGWSERKVSVLINTGALTPSLFQPHQDYLGYGGKPLQGIKAGDLDGDGDLDLVVLENVDAGQPSEANLLVNNGSGMFEDAGAILVGETDSNLEVADLNHDGRADLVVSRWNGLSVLISTP